MSRPESTLMESVDNRATFLVWDSEELPPEGQGTPVLWRRFGEDGSASEYSIPRRVEELSDTLRARFLGWIYDLGEAKINGRRLIDNLALRPELSYWWMFVGVGKCDYTNLPHIYDALRLLAFEELIAAHSVSRIILASGDKTLARTFSLWCRNADLPFEWRRLQREIKPDSLVKKLYRALPHPVQALIFLLRYLWTRWPLRQNGKFALSAFDSRVTFVDYLIHLDPGALATGKFGSNYWTDLIGALDKGAVQVNWLHHYVIHEAVPTARQARDLIARFNQNCAETSSHTTPNGVLGWPVLWRAVCDYGRIVVIGLGLRKVRSHFRPVHSKVNLWPLFEQDWRNSVFGAMAMSNCLLLNLLERTLRNLPYQAMGVYLQENQGWEIAFVHAWKAAGHGRLVGVPHSTIRYWDLRYFFDPRSYQRTDMNNLPLPDLIALNGPAPVAIFQEGGFPKDRIVEVEALRYIYLADRSPRRSDSEKLLDGPLRVLVIGDYLPSATREQMQWLVEAAPSLPANTRYVVKPHPGYSIKANDYPEVRLRITNSPLEDLLGDCDVVFTSNITSGAVDAYCAGVPVVSVLNGDAFNMSPLRGLADVVFVTGPRELVHALRHPPTNKEVMTDGYFHIDKKLPRWRNLLLEFAG